MQNLKVFLFQQSWFHLGSLVESIMLHSKNFQKIDIYFFGNGLFVYPIDVHQIFWRQSRFLPAPEVIMAQFLKKELEKTPINFSFAYAHLPRSKTMHSLFNNVNDLQSLQKIQWENTSIGMAVSSYLITLTRDSNLFLGKYHNLVRSLGFTYFQIFEYLTKLKLEPKKDQIWIYNGRPFHERTVVEYAKKNKILIKYFEIGGEGFNQERWILHNESPHDRIKHQLSITSHFLNTTQNLTLIDEWFSKNKKIMENLNFKDSHTRQNLKMSSNTFVYFSSSDDEVAAISDSWQSCWGLQIDCVKALIKYFESRPELFLIIRVHPNQGLRAKQDKAKWKSLQTTSKNVVIYNYDSKVNSYDLMSKAVAVFTYGSTIGVEAAYLRKPAALLAPARWDQLIPHKYLQSHLELDDWVSSVINRSSNIYESLNECYDGSIKWAHYMISAGAPWSKIQVKKDFRKVNLGYLGGKSLKPKLMIILVSRLFKKLHFCLFEYGNFVKFPSR